MKAPCYGCQRRTTIPNCHAACEEYLEFVRWREELREKRHSIIKIRHIILNHPKDKNRKPKVK